MTKSNKLKLKIEGMHCSSCAMSIDFDLEDLEGVLQVRTSYASQGCEIEYDQEKVSLERILETIEKVGYKGKVQE